MVIEVYRYFTLCLNWTKSHRQCCVILNEIFQRNDNSLLHL